MIFYMSVKRKRKKSIHSHPSAIGRLGFIMLIEYHINWCFRNIKWIISRLSTFLMRKTYLIYINLWRCTTISELMINEQIRDKEVRVISESGEQLGIMSAKEAMKLAAEAELDLVKIAPTAKPPVCKIIDYGKYRYELARKEKDAKKKQKTVEVKEVRLSPNIDTNDLNTKVNSAKKFIQKGDKVKVTLRFRGREMAHMQTSKHILDDFADMMKDVASIEKPAKLEGRSISMVLTEKR